MIFYTSIAFTKKSPVAGAFLEKQQQAISFKKR